jgi:hypothetical protein
MPPIFDALAELLAREPPQTASAADDLEDESDAAASDSAVEQPPDRAPRGRQRRRKRAHDDSGEAASDSVLADADALSIDVAVDEPHGDEEGVGDETAPVGPAPPAPEWLEPPHIELLLFIYNWEWVGHEHLFDLLPPHARVSEVVIRRLLRQLTSAGFIQDFTIRHLFLRCPDFLRHCARPLTRAYRATAVGVRVLRWAGVLGGAGSAAGLSDAEQIRYLAQAPHDLQAVEFLTQLYQNAPLIGHRLLLEESRGPRRLRSEISEIALGRGEAPAIFPDAFVVYHVPEQPLTMGFFLEIDRGTESGRQFATKIRSYQRWVEQSRRWEMYDLMAGRPGYETPSFPPVLVVTPNEHRLRQLWVLTYHYRAARPIWYFTTWEWIDRFGILGAIWNRMARTGIDRLYSIPEIVLLRE